MSDAVWNEADKHFDESQLAALILAIAAINVWNRLTSPCASPSAPGRCDRDSSLRNFISPSREG